MNKQFKTNLKTVFIYLGITLFCALFSTIYELNGHGVYSNYMIYLFLFPLVGGVVPSFFIAIIEKKPSPAPWALRLYHSGIATLIVGSCVTGILEIYGSTNHYTIIYWVVGSLLIVCGIIKYFCKA